MLKEIDRIKDTFIHWLANETSCFPYNCIFSSQVLGSYFKGRGYEPFICYGTYKGNEHCWVEYDDIIIDFTAIQFIYTKDELKAMPKSNLYQKMKTLIYSSKTPDHEIFSTMPFLYTSHIQNKSFSEFLTTIKENKEEQKLYGER